jgi:hypothetical protein
MKILLNDLSRAGRQVDFIKDNAYYIVNYVRVL